MPITVEGGETHKKMKVVTVEMPRITGRRGKSIKRSTPSTVRMCASLLLKSVQDKKKSIVPLLKMMCKLATGLAIQYLNFALLLTHAGK